MEHSNFYDADLVTHLDPLSLISEAFKIARTNIEFSSIDTALRTVAITSSNQSEGKTITICNLAIAYAQIGRKVLLIDADLRRPTIHKLFGLSNRRGLTNVLISGQPYAEYVQPTLTENLAVLTSGPVPPNPAELLMSISLARLLDRMKQDFDLILFDCPPIGAVTDAAIIATKVDGMIYVVRAGKVDRKQLQRASNLLKQVKARVLGYVLNGISPDTDDYYRYYYYYDQNPHGSDAQSPTHMSKHRHRKSTSRQKSATPGSRVESPRLRAPDISVSPSDSKAGGVESEHD
jgi:capsular exopolysaccharide synthesis family protein